MSEGCFKFESYDEFENAIRDFDQELYDQGIEIDGMILGSGALAYHLEEAGEAVPFGMKDADIYTTPEQVEQIAGTPYGVSLNDRNLGGGIYVLGDDREEMPYSFEKVELTTGICENVPTVDIVTRLDTTPKTWQLRADYQNGEGDMIEGLNSDLRVIPLSTFLTTKEGENSEKDKEHEELAKLML